jgi:hypothetical protein
MNEFICRENIKYLKARLLDGVVGGEPKQNAKRETTIEKLIESEEHHLREILGGKE